MTASALARLANTAKSNWPAGLLMAIHAGLILFLTSWYAPTQDEVAQLPAGLAIWKQGRFDLYRVNPPLARAVAAAPVLFLPHEEDWRRAHPDRPGRIEWDVGADFVAANPEHWLRCFQLARWACLPFSLLGLAICWDWGRELTNRWGGFVAAALWCFSPALLGHGALITPDAATVSLGLLAAWRLHHWLRNPSWNQTYQAGLCLGLATLAKSFWIFLFVLWPMIWALDRALFAARSRMGWKGELLRGAAVLAIGLNVLNLGYLYLGTGTQLGDFAFFSRALSGELRDPHQDPPGNRFRGQWLGRLPTPLPRDFVTGIDLQKRDLELRPGSYLLGQTRRDGWWHYYLIGLLVKTPLGTWWLFVLGTFALFRESVFLKLRIRALLPLFVPAAAHLILISSQTGMNAHVRYAYAVLPAVFLTSAFSAGNRRVWPVVAGLAASILGSLWVYPHSLSYFNLLAGGPKGGPRVVIDSNVDWGQDMLRVRDWIRNHPEARPATLSWSASYDASALGLDLPRTPPGGLTPGWSVISVHFLHDVRYSLEAYRKLEPVDSVGFTFNIYHVSEGQTQTDAKPDPF